MERLVPLTNNDHTVRTSGEVVSACAWSDGGAEFVFEDGVVMAFGRNLDTFTVLRPDLTVPRDKTNLAAVRELHFTAMALSRDAAKVGQALAVYNALSPRPKLIRPLVEATGASVLLWTSFLPIDSCVLCGKEEEMDASSDSQKPVDQFVQRLPSGAVRVWSSAHHVALTLSPNRRTVTVLWPARVLEPRGPSVRFVRPTAARDDNPHLVSNESVKATPFVPLQQCFFVEDILNAPNRRQPGSDYWSDLSCWQPFLNAALAADLLQSTSFVTLPDTLLPIDPDATATFPDVAEESLLSFHAGRRTMHSCQAQSRLHSQSSTVVWRWERKSWAAVACCHDPRTLRCLVFEDGSVISMGPILNPPAPHTSLSKLVVVHHSAKQDLADDGREFIFEEDSSVPSLVFTAPTNPDEMEKAIGEYSWDVPQLKGMSARELPLAHRGRYLPDVVRTCAAIVQTNHTRLCSSSASSVNAPSLSNFHKLRSSQSTNLGLNISSTVDNEHDRVNRLILFASRIDQIGNFTAFTNGVVRCAFDDRTILTITTDASCSDENAVVNVLDANAVSSRFRLAVCGPEHPFYSYMSYAVPFMRYARLTPQQRTAAIADCDLGVQQAVHNAQVHQTRYAVEALQIENLVFRAQAALRESQEVTNTSKVLLSPENIPPAPVQRRYTF